MEVRLTTSRKILVISAYWPQADCPFKFNNNLEETLQNAVRANFTEVLLLGDFNHPDLKWGTKDEKNVPQYSSDFVSLTESYGLNQFNKNASTKAGNILELILTLSNQSVLVITPYVQIISCYNLKYLHSMRNL